VLLGFGFVFASAFAEATPDWQSQAALGMRLRSASPNHQNPSLPHGSSIYSNAHRHLANTPAFLKNAPAILPHL
jgi:hypothetical protein